MFPYLRHGLPKKNSYDFGISDGYKMTVKCYGVAPCGKNKGCPVGRLIVESLESERSRKETEEYNAHQVRVEDKIIHRPFRMGIGNIFKPINLLRGEDAIIELNDKMDLHPKKKYKRLDEDMLKKLGFEAFEPYVTSKFVPMLRPDFARPSKHIDSQ